MIEAKRALGPSGKLNGRKLTKKDVMKASLNLYTYRWQFKTLDKSTKKRAS